jgi:3-hydroxybutyryl-CoA dehydrogenase
MHIQIRATEEQKTILLQKNIDPNFKISWFTNEILSTDGYVDLLFDGDISIYSEISNKPIIINSITKTCESLPNNYCRINAWNGFLEKDKIELAYIPNSLASSFEKILNGLGFEVLHVPDIVGMISPRAISMIINEAYFGLEDKISSKKDFDIAMKLGTNYPFGPFEWAEKIGLKYVASLLLELSKTDSKYIPSSLLLQEAKF